MTYVHVYDKYMTYKHVDFKFLNRFSIKYKTGLTRTVYISYYDFCVRKCSVTQAHNL